MRLIGPINSGAATGGAGVAAANADTTTVVRGLVHSIAIKYNGSPPAGTTDVVIKTKGTGAAPPSLTILTITDAATDGWFHPRHKIDDETGADVIYATGNEVHDRVAVHDIINVAIAGANDDDNVDVWLLVQDY